MSPSLCPCLFARMFCSSMNHWALESLLGSSLAFNKQLLNEQMKRLNSLPAMLTPLTYLFKPPVLFCLFYFSPWEFFSLNFAIMDFSLLF